MRTATKHLKEDESTVRQSVSFTQSQHEALVALAEKNNVSVGYVVRKACDLFMSTCGDQVNDLAAVAEGRSNANGKP